MGASRHPHPSLNHGHPPGWAHTFNLSPCLWPVGQWQWQGLGTEALIKLAQTPSGRGPRAALPRPRRACRPDP
eukprot:scaffold5730_cov25-Tisochrysis_lutea.AAC.1